MNTVWYHLSVESEKKKFELILTERRMVITKAIKWVENGNAGQRVHTFSYKLNNVWESNEHHGDSSW